MKPPKLVVAFAFSALIIAGGCKIGPAPRLRFGCYPSSTVGTKYLDAANLGPHGYNFNPFEKNGIVYTCRGGHIDIAHLRITADWTKYLSERALKCIESGKKEFSFCYKPEKSKYYVKIDYPPNFDELTEKERKQIARTVAVETGQYAAFVASTWHEILTWFGYKCIGPLPEFPSAFSWEDNYSNLLGIHVGTKAMYRDYMSYNKAVTMVLNEELQKLHPLPPSVAKKATEKMRGKWFNGNVIFMVDMRLRDFDIGLDDGQIKPVALPDVSQCESVELAFLSAPRLDYCWAAGFSVKIQIRPREWERGKILKIAYQQDGKNHRIIEPDKHFPIIMEYIKNDAEKKHMLGG